MRLELESGGKTALAIADRVSARTKGNDLVAVVFRPSLNISDLAGHFKKSGYMDSIKNTCLCVIVFVGTIVTAVNIFAAAPQQDSQSARHSLQVWLGARVIDGSGRPAIENATLLVRDGRIEAVGRQVKIPAGAER